jgi:hypothetical protein
MELQNLEFTLFVLKLAFAAFFAILFLQSGFDKLLNFRDNLSWLSGHFAQSPLAGFVPLLLICITLTELCAGLLSACGLVQLLVFRQASLAVWGNIGALLALLCLFLGQRIAKDYAVAATLVGYFIAATAGLLVLSL